MIKGLVEKIMEAMPQVDHVVTFYNDGTVFQTTFDRSQVTIPTLGTELSKVLKHFDKLYETSGYDLKEYRKIIFDTNDVSVIILKLGENSNLALFVKKEIPEHRIRSFELQSHLNKIQELIDVDRRKLAEKEHETKITELLEIQAILEEKEEEKAKLEEKKRALKETIKHLDPKEQKKELKTAQEKLERLEEEQRTIAKTITNLREKNIPALRHDLEGLKDIITDQQQDKD